MVADTEEGAAPPETETETETRDEGSATPPLPEAPTEAPPKEGAGGPHQGNRTKGEARATKGDTGRKEGAKGKAGEVQGEIELAPVAEPEALPEPFSMDKEGAAGPSASLPDVPAWDEDENDDGGWGAWGNFGQNLAAAGFGLGAKLQEGLQEAAETAASLKDTLQEAVNETVAQDDKIGESSASKPNLEADSFEARRAQFLDNVEDQTASTDVVKNLDDHISYFATGAASLFGSVLGNAQKIATSAATDIQESFSQGVTDVAELTKKSGAVKVASTGLKLAADHTVKLAEMSLEKAGSTAKGILDMAEVVAGLDGPGPKDGARAGEEEDLSFSRAWFIYGGPDAAEDMDHMSVKSNAISNGIKVKLSGDLLSEYEGLVKMLGAKFDLSTAEVEGEGLEPLGSYDAIRQRRARACAEVATFVNFQMSQVDAQVGQQIQVVKNEGVQQLAEHTCVAVRYLVQLGRSIAEPLNLFEDCQEDIVWPEDPASVAAIVRATVKEISRDLEEISAAFVGESTKFSNWNEALREPMGALQSQLETAREEALDKVREALRGMLFIIAAAHFASS